MLPPSRSLDTPRPEFSPHDVSREDMMREPDAPRRPATLLPWAIKLCLGVGLTALGAAHALSRITEGVAPRPVVARADVVEPETTGSLGAPAIRPPRDPFTALGLRR